MSQDGYRGILAGLEAEGRLRRIPGHRAGGGLLDLCSNDYMGLAARAGEWREEFRARFGDVAMTSSASRLLASDQKVYTALESWLEASYGRPALLFNSGYHANVGVVSALDIPGTLWLADKLVHASAIDGLRLAGADFKRWRHNDTASLRRLLDKESGRYDRVMVVCESVYSMDGDMAPLAELAAIKKENPKVMLYVDEAHAVGVYGRRGLGLCEHLGMLEDADILVGTLGKACASAGAFVVASPLIKEFLINSARSFIFSTALAPANAAWSLMMLGKLAGMERERGHLAMLSARFRAGVEAITGLANPSRSAIVPLMTGSAERAVAISHGLEEAGILALPIRRPTVPPGGERIRFSLNAALTVDDIDRVCSTLADICAETK